VKRYQVRFSDTIIVVCADDAPEEEILEQAIAECDFPATMIEEVPLTVEKKELPK